MIGTSWVEELSAAHKFIDSDHQAYFDHLRQISILVDSNESKRRIAEELELFHQYARYHFMHEEILMRDSNYVGYMAHKNAHAEFLERIVNKIQQFEAGTCASEKLLAYLQAWHAMHTSNEDKEFGDHLQLVKLTKA